MSNWMWVGVAILIVLAILWLIGIRIDVNLGMLRFDGGKVF